MNEKKAAAARPRRLACPIQVVDPAARDHHELRLPGVGNGPPKPIGRRRADRKEIGWYGFAAQGGCTRITGWVLPLIGQHYIGRRDPAHSVTRRQQRYLAVRGASTMLDDAAFLSWRGRTGCHTSVSPRGTEGSNPSTSRGESTNFRFLSRRRPLIRRAAGVHPRLGRASLAIRQIDDAFFDNGRARAAGQRAARRDELPAADPARSVSSHDDRRSAAS